MINWLLLRKLWVVLIGRIKLSQIVQKFPAKNPGLFDRNRLIAIISSLWHVVFVESHLRSTLEISCWTRRVDFVVSRHRVKIIDRKTGCLPSKVIYSLHPVAQPNLWRVPCCLDVLGDTHSWGVVSLWKVSSRRISMIIPNVTRGLTAGGGGCRR